MGGTNVVKMRLKDGDREIELEGTPDELDRLLATWWHKSVPSSQDRVARREETRPRPRRNPKPQASASESESTLDAHQIAMQIKEHERSALFESKVLHKSDIWRKCEFVIWYVNTALTSGQILEILTSLDVKHSLPSISITLKRNSADLISDQQRKRGGTPAAYRLTSKAKAEFESWLNGEEA